MRTHRQEGHRRAGRPWCAAPEPGRRAATPATGAAGRERAAEGSRAPPHRRRAGRTRLTEPASARGAVRRAPCRSRTSCLTPALARALSRVAHVTVALFLVPLRERERRIACRCSACLDAPARLRPVSVLAALPLIVQPAVSASMERRRSCALRRERAETTHGAMPRPP